MWSDCGSDKNKDLNIDNGPALTLASVLTLDPVTGAENERSRSRCGLVLYLSSTSFITQYSNLIFSRQKCIIINARLLHIKYPVKAIYATRHVCAYTRSRARDARTYKHTHTHTHTHIHTHTRTQTHIHIIAGTNLWV